VREKCLEQVGLGPEHAEGGICGIDFGVFVGKIDIMKVHCNSRGQTRQHIEDEKIHVASYFGNMAGINKQNVILGELIKEARAQKLHTIPDESGQAGKCPRHMVVSGIGINYRVVTVLRRLIAIQANSRRDYQGGETRANFYNPLRLQVSDHAVQACRTPEAEAAIVGVELEWSVCRLFGPSALLPIVLSQLKE